MKSIEIKGTGRTDVGKKATHELRKNNGVPCVLYGVQKDENGLPVATHFLICKHNIRTKLMRQIVQPEVHKEHTIYGFQVKLPFGSFLTLPGNSL